MNPHAVRAAEVESTFLAGVESQLNQAKGFRLRGSRFASTTRSEEDRVRGLMATRRQFDRQVLRDMPKNKTYVLTGSQPRFLFGRRTTSVAVATVLSPIEHYLDGDAPGPPIGLTEVLDHVKQVVGDAAVPHLVGVCSPTGFTEEAREARISLPNVTVVLVEPRGDGGWNIRGGSPNVPEADRRLFDPEGVTQKLRRVREEIDASSADLLTGGLSAQTIAERLGLPMRLVSAGFEHAAAADPELKTSRQRDDVLLYRGAPARVEEDTMSMTDRIRQLLKREGDETRKINLLSERRAKLTQRRDRVYADITKLEAREGALFDQGREATSATVKRRVASQIKQLRDDINRLNTTARMLGQQVDVISTHIHNLTLIQQGQLAKLPSTEEITEDAVRAEEMLEQLGADAEMIGSLSTGLDDTLTTDEEREILKELESPAAVAEKESPSPPPKTAARAEPVPPASESPSKRREPEAG